MLCVLNSALKSRPCQQIFCSKLWSRSNATSTTGNKIKLPTEADVVVIGGGSIGCSTIYHLAKLGVKNCVLVERAKIASGTTWHTAGLLWRLRPSDIDIEILAYTRKLNKEILAQEIGEESTTGWIENGGLFIANNSRRLDEYRRLQTLGKFFGIDSYILTAAETKALYPLLNVKDIYGTLYSPGDGLIDSTAYCAALTKVAKQNRALIVEDCPVQKINVKQNDFGSKQVESVETKLGLIKTKLVINCAGVWAPKIGQMAGVNVPLLPMKHAYVVTEKIPGVANMPNVRDHDSSIYLKTQGDTLAVGGYEPNPIFCETVSDDFAFSLYDLDYDVFNVNIKGATNRLPALEHTGIKSEICGPESFTPDHKPLMGESPEVRGFYLNCAFNSAGMMLSGGCGHQLAHWVVNGSPTVHMHAYDIHRFYNKLTNDNKWIEERSHESYLNNYEIVFPNSEPLAGRNKRKSPLHEILEAKGCIFQERLGWERPAWFDSNMEQCVVKQYDYYGYYGHSKNEDHKYQDKIRLDEVFDFPQHHDTIVKECINCQENAVVFDFTDAGKFYISGKDSKSFVDWLFTTDVHTNNRPIGSTFNSLILNDRGGIEGDITISMVEKDYLNKCPGPSYYLTCDGPAAEKVESFMSNEISSCGLKNVDLWNVTEEISILSVQGPKSINILKQLIDNDVDEFFKTGQSKIVKIAGKECRILKWSTVGQTYGFELHTVNENIPNVYEAVMSLPKEINVKDAGYRAFDFLNLEAGSKLWGTDLRLTDTPAEAGLASLCKIDTPVNFKGRKALEDQLKNGIQKRHIQLAIDKKMPMWGMETIIRNGEVVGVVRRAGCSPKTGKTIANGYVKGDNIDEPWIRNGKYEVESMGQKVRAHLVSDA